MQPWTPAHLGFHYLGGILARLLLNRWNMKFLELPLMHRWCRKKTYRCQKSLKVSTNRFFVQFFCLAIRKMWFPRCQLLEVSLHYKRKVILRPVEKQIKAHTVNGRIRNGNFVEVNRHRCFYSLISLVNHGALCVLLAISNEEVKARHEL